MNAKFHKCYDDYGNLKDNALNIAFNIGLTSGKKQAKAELLADLEQRLRFWDNKANAIPEYVWHCINAMKEQKLCSNGKTCTHPNCKRCGTTHFMSECDYGKEQKNE